MLIGWVGKKCFVTISCGWWYTWTYNSVPKYVLTNCSSPSCIQCPSPIYTVCPALKSWSLLERNYHNPNHNHNFLKMNTTTTTTAQSFLERAPQPQPQPNFPKIDNPNPNPNTIFPKMTTPTPAQFFQKWPPQPLQLPQFLDFVHHNPNPYHNFWKLNTTTTTTTQFLGKNDHKLWFTTIVPQFYAHPWCWGLPPLLPAAHVFQRFQTICRWKCLRLNSVKMSYCLL